MDELDNNTCKHEFVEYADPESGPSVDDIECKHCGAPWVPPSQEEKA